MEMDAFMFDVPEWLVALGLLAAMLGAIALGRRYGEHDRARFGEKNDEGWSLSGAALGLLALLLAFTYSVVSAHFDNRKQLVVKESNAIGTAWLRTDFAPEASRRELRELLRDYVDLRCNFSHAGRDPKEHAALLEKSDRLQEAIWSATIRSVAGRPSTPVDALLIDAVNAMIDVHSERLRAHRDHVPSIVIGLLISVALASVGLVGYAAGRKGEQRHWMRTLIPLLLVAVIVLIIDLDRPREGFILVSQQPLLDLQVAIHASPAPSLPAAPTGK
jgi:hypothetical protein